MEILRKLPQETLVHLFTHFDIDPNPSGVWGLWIFRGDKFVKVKTGEVYIIEMAFFNKQRKVVDNVEVPVGWRYMFRHLGTKALKDISSETLRSLFKDGLLVRASAESRPITEEFTKVKSVLTTIDFSQINGLRMDYEKSVITDLSKYISSHAAGLSSDSNIIYRNSVDALMKLFKTLHAWPA